MIVCFGEFCQLVYPHLGKMCSLVIPCALTALDHWSPEVKVGSQTHILHLSVVVVYVMLEEIYSFVPINFFSLFLMIME